MEDKKVSIKGIHKMVLVFLIITILMILILFYSRFVETKKLEVNEYRIINENFTGKLHGYKIVHISDIHYGKTTSKEDLEKIVEKINLIKPNMLIFTGDLIDKDTVLNEELTEEVELILSKLDDRIICYSIKGEDDLKTDHYGLIMENAGFISLDNKYETLYLNQKDYILLSGISTRKENNVVEETLNKTNEFLNNTKDNKPIYSIFLMHEPDMVDSINIENYNLLLAGHSHGGQVKIPFIGAIQYPKYANKYNKSYQQIDEVDFYITSGIGTTTYGFRLFNPPSLNLYRIVSY